MIAANANQCIVSKQIENVTFEFYTDEDVRARSVCEITSSMAVDGLGHPLPNGVYDPRLGPASASGGTPSCPTCALRFLACPGHFGHVELCVPLYHPLLFGKLVELLRMKCWFCHRLTCPKQVLQQYQLKLELLELGAYNQAMELDGRIAACQKQNRLDGNTKSNSRQQQGPMESESALQHVLQEVQASIDQQRQQQQQQQHSSPQPLSTLEQAYQREIVKQVVSHCKSAKNCPHCGAISPKIRQDSSNKVFQAPLSAKSKRLNAAEGLGNLVPAMQQDGSPTTTTNHADDASSNDDDDNDRDVPTTPKETTTSTGRDKYMHPAEVQAQVKRTWESMPQLCNALFATQGHQIFFMQAVPVPPSRFRPPMQLGGMMVEHAQNVYLNSMIQANELVRSYFANSQEALAYKQWIELQTHLNCFMDSSKDPSGAAAASQNQTTGIRQLLERKEGIFRKHMMGKRVNYCCRSVISPDPYIGANEIGLPQAFAKALTYPTPVTDLNISEMTELVERGADHYPGAKWVEFPDRRVDLGKMDAHKREAIASRLLSHSKKGTGPPAIVGRQMRDGDMVLMNRQPTLHKPGIMAHEVRVLHDPNQKTIRMHYANCNTYNADYDGDEMNCHFPQSDLGRAEATHIARTDLQFIVPTDGSPLRGLIQDHVVGGVKLTKRDTFLEKWEYQQLLFAALSSLPRLEVIRTDADIELMPPAILKPKPRWTGKQVISTLLNHLRKGNDRDLGRSEPLPGISTERKTKTPASAFGEVTEEHQLIIRDGELLRGVLDKAAFGATDFSLVHAVFEAYGPSKAGLLLNALGRLFTSFIQNFSGHSCRMEDLVLTPESDDTRRQLIQKAYNVGSRAAKAWADSEGGKVSIDMDENDATEKGPLKPVEAAASAAKVRQLLSGSERAANWANFDGYMMSKLNPLASDIVKACLPGGLAVPFPANTFGIMVTTGAKGSIVNQSQVTCSLGQQALEGRRVPRLASGKTLPSFAPYDVNPRADGFVMDRFLTGIRPQEYYFHCMAGREGLVDTAVKTSRSGYLQRCLVKHLEELKIAYDYTVRNGEGGVVQFLYGEDGLDPTKASYLDCSEKSFVYMARNHGSLKRGQVALPESSLAASSTDAARAKAVANQKEGLLEVGDFVLARRLRAGQEWVRGSLCHGWFDAIIVRKRKNGKQFDLKYTSDESVTKNVPLEVDLGRSDAESSLCLLIKPAAADPTISSSRKSHRLGTHGTCVSERIAAEASQALCRSETLKQALEANDVSENDFGTLVAAKYGAAICNPGEAVGAIAAQSIGEPSTQMTLNTFHLAGSGANVTLGIPRLREIIMTASRELKTPTMSVPLKKNISSAEATKLTRSFTKLSLNELIATDRGVSVRETLAQGDSGMWQRAYYVSVRFHPAERIQTAFQLSLNEIAGVVSSAFVPALARQMKLELRRASPDGQSNLDVEGGESREFVESAIADDDEGLRSGKRSQSGQDDSDDEDEGDDDERNVEDGVKASAKQAESYGVHDEEQEEEEAENSDDSSSQESRREEVDKTDAENVPKTRFALETPSSEGVAFGVDGLKVDIKNNCIHLQALRVDPAARPLLMVGLVEKAASKVLVRSRKKIDAAYVNDETGRGRCLQTAGINFSEMWRLESVNHHALLSNDIWAVRCAYGVEAARRTIVDQIRNVFGVYGIEVDPRHLSLIADYMTYSGGYTAMNRNGMKEMSSPFLQMSFETTAQFLTQAAITTTSDQLQSPSSNIVLGRPIRHGTGAFSLMVK